MLSDEIVIPPKVPVNPSAKPGVGGLAAIPDLVSGILGGGEFCSVWSMYGGLCQPDDISKPLDQQIWIPAWCKAWADGPLCTDNQPVNVETGLVFPNDGACFNSLWQKISCGDWQQRAVKCAVFDGKNMVTVSQPCNLWGGVCQTSEGAFISCNSLLISDGDTYSTNYSVNLKSPGKCYQGQGAYDYVNQPVVPCLVTLRTIEQIPAAQKPALQNNMFDKYMRVIDPVTLLPKTDETFIEGYPKALMLPPVEEEDETPVPGVPTENCGVICDWLELIYNMTVSIDSQLMGMLDYLEKVIVGIQPPVTIDYTEKIDKLLKAIDDISVDVAKEAGTNFWDMLGGAFGDIFDLIEFLIEKIIYLVVPEDTTSIMNAFKLLEDDLKGKVAPIHEIQSHITSAIPTGNKEFENIAITLPKYGNVTFFKVDYLLMAIPFIRQLLSALLVLTTAIWAYRKVSSEMVR